MSLEASKWVFRHSKATHGAWQVAVVLADHANPDGSNARPAVATIMEEANMKRTAVKAGLRTLIPSSDRPRA